MELVQSLTQKTSLAMTQRMQASLRLLRMNNQELAEYLAEQALENPCIDVRLPAGVSGPRTMSGPEWDAVSALQSQKPSLCAHVSEQIELTFSEPWQKRIAYAFLEALEPSGWLGTDVRAVAMACGVSEGKAEIVLKLLQRFEPAGLFARSLSECLRLQAEDQDLLTWELEALIDNLPLLAEGATAKLAEICDCAPDDIPDIAATLRRFNPKPGQSFADDRPPIFPPDLTARHVGGEWQVALNRSNLPTVRISDAALDGAAQAGKETRRYRTQALSNARWLVGALHRRQTTLLRIATTVIAHQSAFLEKGPGNLRPLSLEDVGATLDLHSSTISRAIAGRMIDTPLGALPVKSLFSRAFQPASGGSEQSQDCVLQLVCRIVGNEDRARPLSDTAIAKIAAREGVRMARRTVAKYRDVLGIASSYQRRSAVGA